MWDRKYQEWKLKSGESDLKFETNEKSIGVTPGISIPKCRFLIANA